MNLELLDSKYNKNESRGNINEFGDNKYESRIYHPNPT